MRHNRSAGLLNLLRRLPDLTLVAILFHALQPNTSADLVIISEIQLPKGGASCAAVRSYFLQLTVDMQENSRRVWQYGLDEDTRPMFEINAIENRLDDGLSEYGLPNSLFDKAFLGCFSPEIKNPGSHEDASKRIKIVEACIRKASCDLELPEIPEWLREAMIGLDSNQLQTRQKTLQDLLARIAALKTATDADQFSRQLLAGQKTRKTIDGVADALSHAISAARTQHRKLRLAQWKDGVK